MASGYPLTPSTFMVNDQQYTAPYSSFFNPTNVTGPSFIGSSQGLQTIPVGVGATLGVGGGTSAAGAVAGANPWSPTKAPLVLMVGMFIAGVLILRYIHWRA